MQCDLVVIKLCLCLNWPLGSTLVTELEVAEVLPFTTRRRNLGASVYSLKMTDREESSGHLKLILFRIMFHLL